MTPEWAPSSHVPNRAKAPGRKRTSSAKWSQDKRSKLRETRTLPTHLDFLADDDALNSDTPFALEIESRFIRDDMTWFDGRRPTDTRRDCKVVEGSQPVVHQRGYIATDAREHCIMGKKSTVLDYTFDMAGLWRYARKIRADAVSYTVSKVQSFSPQKLSGQGV